MCRVHNLRCVSINVFPAWMVMQFELCSGKLMESRELLNFPPQRSFILWRSPGLPHFSPNLKKCDSHWPMCDLRESRKILQPTWPYSCHPFLCSVPVPTMVMVSFSSLESFACFHRRIQKSHLVSLFMYFSFSESLL